MNRPDSRHLTTSMISLSGSCIAAAAEELLVGLKAPELDFEILNAPELDFKYSELDFEIPVRVEVLQNSPRKLLQLDESA